MAEKTKGQQLAEALMFTPKQAGMTLSQEEIDRAYDFCGDYMQFLNTAKTERLAAGRTVALLEAAGFVPFDRTHGYKAGDRVYLNNRGKAVIAAVIGRKPVAEGVRIVAAHIDAPRLDLKPNPLYEDSDLALLKTHYYGGIKKYQWAAIPLALHGVVIKRDGSQVEVSIGEEPGDPVFCVTDLLPHLAGEQMKRTLSAGIKGEELNILVGSMPFKDDQQSELVKLNILRILHEKYGMVEADFLSAELEAVPAYPVRDLGFDRSMIGGYAHDDRVCAYTALRAVLDVEAPLSTVITVLTDKEETGSDGNTGLNSAYLRYFIADLAEAEGVSARTVLSASKCLSADVNAAHDPTFPDVTDKRNAARLGYGVALMKYSGSRGKSGTSDASAEFTGEVCRLLDQAGVIWQQGELGKVDMGGGGTVALYVANLDVDVIDIGVPVLSMHAPFEVVSKLDVYMAYRAFRAFFEQK